MTSIHIKLYISGCKNSNSTKQLKNRNVLRATNISQKYASISALKLQWSEVTLPVPKPATIREGVPAFKKKKFSNHSLEDQAIMFMNHGSVCT